MADKTQTNLSVIEIVAGAPRARMVYTPRLGAEVALSAALRLAENICWTTGNDTQVMAIENQPVR
jgi:hypothetical protein